MKKTILLLTTGAIFVFTFGCATPHYTPVPCATIQPPPEKVVVKGEIWKVKDPATGKIVKKYVFSEIQWFVIEQVIKSKDSYIEQCFDLIGEKD
jgi:hypothetical protein